MDNTINPIVLDISHHNEITVDGFARMYAYGIRGVIHKASQGLSYADLRYANRRADAVKAGLLWGAYHFADNSDPEAQLRRFLTAAKPDKDTLLALDYEENEHRTMSIEGARAFLHALELATGRKGVIYSGNLLKETLTKPDVFLNAHRLWLAEYNNDPKMPVGWENAWLWQFSGDGTNAHGLAVPGIRGEIDIDSYSGTANLLTSEWAVKTISPSTAVIDQDQLRVTKLQTQLTANGFDTGPADGVLGPQTVKAFQKAHHLFVDGLVGPETRPALTAALSQL